MTNAFARLFVRSQLFALERQLSLPEVVIQGDWVFELDQGRVRFTHGDEERAVPVQLLGTQSDEGSSWLWAWANRQSQLPDGLLRDARLLQAWGAEHGVHELTQATFPLTEADGHQLAMVAISLLGAPGYYRCPYDGGALFVILADPSLRPPPERPVLHMATMAGAVLETVEVLRHPWAVRGWFEHYGMQVQEADGTLVGVHVPTGDALVVEFDEEERIASLQAELAD